MKRVAFALALALAHRAQSQALGGPDTVVVKSGTLELRGVLYRPSGAGPFPAVLFNHGSGPTAEPQKPARLGPVFARHGYVFLFLFRRGAGLSAGQGTNSAELMARAFAAGGQIARNQAQMQLLDAELSDAIAGLAFLRAVPRVDARRVGLAGHSFGGSLTLLLAERDTTVRAAVVFGAAAGSWDGSPELRARLAAAVDRTTAPIFFIHAANDYSTAPGKTLAAAMARRGKEHLLKIYPPVGRTAAEGHDFVYLGRATWEPAVFAFFNEHMRAR